MPPKCRQDLAAAGGGAEARAAAAACVEYLRARVGVPRDMSYPAARQVTRMVAPGAVAGPGGSYRGSLGGDGAGTGGPGLRPAIRNGIFRVRASLSADRGTGIPEFRNSGIPEFCGPAQEVARAVTVAQAAALSEIGLLIVSRAGSSARHGSAVPASGAGPAAISESIGSDWQTGDSHRSLVARAGGHCPPGTPSSVSPPGPKCPAGICARAGHSGRCCCCGPIVAREPGMDSEARGKARGGDPLTSARRRRPRQLRAHLTWMLDSLAASH